MTKSGEHPVVSGGRYRSGWYSTKLHLALIASAVITAVFMFVVWKTGSAAGFGEYCISVVSLVATYSGSRVGETFALRPRGPAPVIQQPPPGGS